MTLQYARIDQRGDVLVVASRSEIEKGHLRPNGWFRILDVTADADVLGQTTLDALSQSGIAPPQPIATPEPPDMILRELGLSSEAAYLKGAKSVHTRRENLITFWPRKNGGTRENFTDLPGASFVLDPEQMRDPASIGRAARRALGRATTDSDSTNGKLSSADATVHQPSAGGAGFGYKSAWLALRADGPHDVAEALGLTDLRALAWSEGIRETDVIIGPWAPVFATPKVDGWVLALLGSPQLFEDDGTNSGLLDLAALSRRFGEVQKFATHRVVEYQEWQRWANGAPVRRYCWIGESGEIRFDEGTPAQAEGSIIRQATFNEDWDGLDFPDEETVMSVAEGWSVNPTTLDVRDDDIPFRSQGLLGYMRVR